MLEIIKYVPSGIILVLTAFLYVKISTNEKETKSTIQIIGASILVTLIYAFVYVYIKGALKSLLNFISIAIYMAYVFDVKISKAIFMSFIHTILLIIAEVICFIILAYILNINNSYIYDVFAGSILSNVVINLIFLVLSVILRKPLQKLFAYEISPNVKISIFTVLSCICILILFYIGFSNLENNNALLVSVFGMVVFLAILFSLVKQKIDNNKITEKYESLIEFMNSYEEKIDDLYW